MAQTFNTDLLPDTTGRDLGSTGARWDLFAQNVDVSGTSTFTSISPKNLAGIRFADQFSGSGVTAKIDAALADATTLLVVVPVTMGAGNATAIPAGKAILDLRSGPPKFFTNASVSSAAWTLNDSGSVSGVFASSSSNPASAGALRVATGDAINFRNAANSGDINGLSKNASDVVSVGSSAGISASSLALAGALSGVTTGAFSGQITSTLSTGTAPLAITSTTVVPNLNIATLNGVTVSGSAVANYVLQASSASAASWANLQNWTYSAGSKRWELYDSTIPTALLDSKPGWNIRCEYGSAFQDATDSQYAVAPLTFQLTNGAGAGSTTIASGRVRLTTGALANNNSYFISSNLTLNTFSNLNTMLLTVDPQGTAGANTNLSCRIGVASSQADSPADGIYIEKLSSDTNWFLVTRASAVQTRGDTTIPATSGTVRSFIIVKTGTSSVSIYSPGSASALVTNSTNIPVDATAFGVLSFAKAATAVAQSLDTYHVHLTGKLTGY